MQAPQHVRLLQDSHSAQPAILDNFVKMSLRNGIWSVILTCPDLSVDPIHLVDTPDKFKALCSAIVARFILRQAYMLARDHAAMIAQLLGHADVAQDIASHLEENIPRRYSDELAAA